MATDAKLSHTAAMILQAIDAGLVYGFSIMEITGLPSGTVYPAMRRLERDEPHRLALGTAIDRCRRTETAAKVLQINYGRFELRSARPANATRCSSASSRLKR